MAFKVGDLVQLKSGGATMVVRSIDGGMVACVWQNRTTGGWEPQSSLYPAEALRMVEAEPQQTAPVTVRPGDDYKVYEEGDD